MAREGVDGTHYNSYMELNRWIMDIRRSNPGTYIKLEYEQRANLDDPPKFKRIFICFEGMKNGILAGCRSFIGLDGCHLKGPFGGVLLAAMALDGDKGIFPLAIRVAENESNSSWGFFLESLNSCIGDGSVDNHIPLCRIAKRESLMLCMQYFHWLIIDISPDTYA
ncbi:hypothetical protein M5689_011180 [Euphorbia peplus]|nr:hypothetical protein M5689_011180 [Euphorbia peplus]